MEQIIIRQATVEDAETVGRLVHTLIREIVPEYEGRKSPEQYIDTAGDLLANHPGVWAFVAEAGTETTGVLTLNECAAIYAGGSFGEICELYVAPAFRSAGVGAKLIDAAVEFGRKRGWPVIEVGAPDIPRWQKSVEFYQRYGFEMVGPRLEFELRD